MSSLDFLRLPSTSKDFERELIKAGVQFPPGGKRRGKVWCPWHVETKTASLSIDLDKPGGLSKAPGSFHCQSRARPTGGPAGGGGIASVIWLQRHHPTVPTPDRPPIAQKNTSINVASPKKHYDAGPERNIEAIYQYPD